MVSSGRRYRRQSPRKGAFPKGNKHLLPRLIGSQAAAAAGTCPADPGPGLGVPTSVGGMGRWRPAGAEQLLRTVISFSWGVLARKAENRLGRCSVAKRTCCVQ